MDHLGVDSLDQVMNASAASTPAPPDRLSKLPTELLDMIFAKAWAKRRPSGPINRALCPFYDRFAWRSIRIDSPARLARFLELTGKRTHLGQLCEELVVELKPAELDVATLTRLFGRTPNLKKLALADLASEVFEHVLNGTKNNLLPMHLRKLDLKCSTGDRKDPYHPSNWSLLDNLTSLNQLGLDLRSAETPTGRIQSKKELPLWPEMTDLEVGLPQKGRSSVLQLIACFPHLRRLSVSSTSPVPDFSGALAALQSPGSLQELVLEAKPKKGWTLPDELEQLTRLHSLKLVGNWHRLATTDMSISATCLSAASSSAATASLPFNRSTKPCSSANFRTSKFCTLTTSPACRVGREVYEDDLPWAWEDQIQVMRDAIRTWRGAKWTREFQHETFKALATLCKARKVKIKGRIRRALHVEQELDAMREDIDALKSMIRMRGTGFYRGMNYGRTYGGDSDYDYDEDDYSDSWAY